eukprot:g4150.t1
MRRKSISHRKSSLTNDREVRWEHLASQIADLPTSSSSSSYSSSSSSDDTNTPTIQNPRWIKSLSVIPLIILSFCLSLIETDQDLLTSSAKQVQKTFSLDITSLTNLLALRSFSQAFAIPIWGFFGDIYANKRKLLFQYALLSFASLLSLTSLFVTSLTLLQIVRILVGISLGAFLPLAHSLIVDYYPSNHRGTALGILSFVQSLGGITGSTLGSFVSTLSEDQTLPESLQSWQLCYLIIAMLTFILLIVFTFFLYDPVPSYIFFLTWGTLASFVGGIATELCELPLVAHFVPRTSLTLAYGVCDAGTVFFTFFASIMVGSIAKYVGYIAEGNVPIYLWSGQERAKNAISLRKAIFSLEAASIFVCILLYIGLFVRRISKVTITETNTINNEGKARGKKVQKDGEPMIEIESENENDYNIVDNEDDTRRPLLPR